MARPPEGITKEMMHWLGNQLRMAREACDLSTRQAARDASISAKTILKYEAGNTTSYNFFIMDRLARTYGKKLNDFSLVISRGEE